MHRSEGRRATLVAAVIALICFGTGAIAAARDDTARPQATARTSPRFTFPLFTQPSAPLTSPRFTFPRTRARRPRPPYTGPTVSGPRFTYPTTTPTTAPPPQPPMRVVEGVRYVPSWLPPGTSGSDLDTSPSVNCVAAPAPAPCSRIAGEITDDYGSESATTPGVTIDVFYTLRRPSDAEIIADTAASPASPPPARITIQGRPAFLAAPEVANNNEIGWRASDTTIVFVSTSCGLKCLHPVTRADAQHIASSLVARPLEIPLDTGRVLAQGTYNDGNGIAAAFFSAWPAALGFAPCVGTIEGYSDDDLGLPAFDGERDAAEGDCSTFDYDPGHNVWVTDDGTFAFGGVRDAKVASIRLLGEGKLVKTTTPFGSISGSRIFFFPVDISRYAAYDVVTVDAQGRAREHWSSDQSSFVPVK